jgi:hypothetical protein
LGKSGEIRKIGGVRGFEGVDGEEKRHKKWQEIAGNDLFSRCLAA